MEQILTFPQIADQIYGVSEPMILNATSDQGSTVNYEIVSGNAEIVDRFQLNLTGTGEVTVKAIAEVNGDYEEAEQTRTFNITDGSNNERMGAILLGSNKLQNDALAFQEIAKVILDNVGKVEFDLSSKDVIVTIDGNKKKLFDKRMTIKYLKGSIQFFESELQAAQARIAELNAQLKSKL